MYPVVDWFGTWFSWFPPFGQSAGFAGVLAVAAVAIAYYAAARNGRKDRRWKRAEYALNLTLSADETVQLAGLALLDTLWSNDPDEQKFITTAAAGLIPPPETSHPATDGLSSTEPAAAAGPNEPNPEIVGSPGSSDDLDAGSSHP